ncbi:MAG: hypothetical protein AAF612_03300 [Planctomycetota bacterium]
MTYLVHSRSTSVCRCFAAWTLLCATFFGAVAQAGPPKPPGVIEASDFDVQVMEFGVSHAPPKGLDFPDSYWLPEKDELNVTLLVTHRGERNLLGLVEDKSHLGPRRMRHADPELGSFYVPSGIGMQEMSRDGMGLAIQSDGLRPPPKGEPLRVRGVFTLLTATGTSPHRIPAADLRAGAMTVGPTTLDWMVFDRGERNLLGQRKGGLEIVFYGTSALRVRTAKLVDADGLPAPNTEIVIETFGNTCSIELPSRRELQPDWALELELWSGLREVRVPVEITAPNWSEPGVARVRVKPDARMRSAGQAEPFAD